MTKFGTHHSKKNVNSLPKWARVYIITQGAEGKILSTASLNALPQWARDQINAIEKVAKHNAREEKAYREENCKGCRHKGKCSPKRRAVCDDLRDIPPC